MTTTDYKTLLETKRAVAHNVGIEVEPDAINSLLFPFQQDLVRWALRKGRCALFADTGLGKTAMQVEWARLIGGKTLIIAPLSVALQTVKEARNLLDVEVHYTRSDSDLIDGINITNYEMIEHFDPAHFAAVVLDESSILKSLNGKTRRLLTEMFAKTPYRLCATATPAPNDITEIGRHAEFLGVMRNEEMLAAFFTTDAKQTDGNAYRLKKHARAKFYEWLASWAIAIKKPSDIGYEDNGYILPDLKVNVREVDTQFTPDGMLPGFNVGSLSAIEAKRVRKGTISERIEICQQATSNNEQWVIWCGLNDEADALQDAIAGSVNVYGAMTPEQKADAIMDFVGGRTRVLITKTSIAGHGINMQNAHNMIFCGIDYSWEMYYQAIRREWRFGQLCEVNVLVVTSSQERDVFERVLAKEREAMTMADELVKRSAQYSMNELRGLEHQEWDYKMDESKRDNWTMWLGDSCERIAEIPDESVDLSVFSPPFIAKYTYTPTERDLGNSDEAQFFAQFGIIIDGLLRITKPGRNCCVHVQQVPATKVHDGYIGIKDFRGDVIRAFNTAGWILYGEVTIDKNPQTQAIRTKKKNLMFVQKNKDSAASAPALADYLLIFQKPGENVVPVETDVTDDEWIQFAHPVWYDIRETDVLNTLVAKSNEDERHICPLQLPVIDRCVRLWSNPGELVFSPFAGIGSEGYQAVLRGRRFLGIELKPEYYEVAKRNLENANRQGSNDLFSWAAAQTANEGIGD